MGNGEWAWGMGNGVLERRERANFLFSPCPPASPASPAPSAPQLLLAAWLLAYLSGLRASY